MVEAEGAVAAGGARALVHVSLAEGAAVAGEACARERGDAVLAARQVLTRVWSE